MDLSSALSADCVSRLERWRSDEKEERGTGNMKFFEIRENLV